MNKFRHYYGIDISKDVFDVIDESGHHYQFSNHREGFKSFLKILSGDNCCVMEATGVYHVRLADYLYQNGVFVSVVNPLIIKRYIQMNSRRIKTDKADAEMICKYARAVHPQPYKPAPEYVKESRILAENMDLLIKSRTMLKNRLHALTHKSDKLRTVLMAPVRKAIHDLTEQIDRLEKELLELVKEEEGDLFTR